ncbi:MAG TPA: SusC/RagA family TonB-linked outer membrane protein [Lacibacter sp.]|nr:SusC/RagA family TonB-linked outer membrane protein [Lacibacter sp.]HMO88072.1 SusC/RagA family TonB-linked outer membrane protein [Lacibacter sp.]
MRKLVLIFLSLLISTVQLYAQEKSVSGKVTDENGQPLAGASITVKGTALGTTTNQGGEFKLSVPANARTLVISSVGYATQEVLIGSQSQFNVSLQTEEASLKEVVVTGLGTATARKKVAIAVESISAKDLPPVPAGSIDRALVGRIPGATIQNTSGQPGQQAAILLRGINTLGSTQPLILVDGVQVNAGGNFNGSGTNTSSRLSDLDLSNVERIEVVQGAAAGTLFGAQGANGVIQIFTKKGAKGAKPSITFNHSTSIDRALRGNLKLAENHFFATNSEGFIVDGSGNRMAPNAFGVYPDPVSTFNASTLNNKPYKEGRVDNLGNLFRQAMTMNHSLNISGGQQGFDYAFNVAHLNQESVVFGRNQRSNLTANMGIDLAKGLKFRTVTQLVYADNNTGGITGQNNVASAIGAANLTRQYIDLLQRNSFGNIVANPGGDNSVNPYYTFDQRRYQALTTRIVQSANLNYKPVKYLEIDYKYGIDNTKYNFEDFINNQTGLLPASGRGSAGIDPINGRITRLNDRETWQNSLLSVFVRTDFEDDFNINLPITTTTQVSYDWRKNNFFRDRSQGTGLPIFPPLNMTTAQSKDASDTRIDFVTYGYLINQRFDYGSLFGVSGGFRADYASTFGEANTPFFFPRGDAYFNVSELLKSDMLTSWKVRAAYGEAGIQPGAYDRQVILGAANIGQSGTLFVPFTAANPALRVERSKELEVGTDLVINPNKKADAIAFKRIALNLTYWTRKGEDVIRAIDVPPSSGVGALLTNAINLESDGWQAALNINVIETKNVTYDFGVNFGRQRTTITRISNGKDIVIGGSGSGQFVLREGVPVGAFFGRKPLGSLDEADSKGVAIIPEAQRGNFEVVNGIVVNKTTKAVAFTNEQVFLGDPTPQFTMTFLNTLTLMKKLTLFVQLDWFQGNKIYNQSRQWLYRDQQHADFDQPVTINGETGAFVAYYNSLYLTNNNNGYFVEDGSFLRLRDVTVTYDFNLSKLKYVKSARLFVSGRNLLTFTNYTGLDPEAAAAFNNPLNRGLDLNVFPNLRSYQAGVTLGF